MRSGQAPRCDANRIFVYFVHGHNGLLQYLNSVNYAEKAGENISRHAGVVMKRQCVPERDSV